MFLVSQLIWQDHVIKRSYNSMGGIHPANFSGHSDCDSGHMFFVVEEQLSTCSCLNPLLQFVSKGHDLKVHAILYCQARS